MNRFKRYYAACFQALAGEYGLNQLEIDILLFLHNNPDCNTASDIVELRGLAKSNVSTAIERLRREGYLRVMPDRGESGGCTCCRSGRAPSCVWPRSSEAVSTA